jgi:hypothetical protein
MKEKGRSGFEEVVWEDGRMGRWGRENILCERGGVAKALQRKKNSEQKHLIRSTGSLTASTCTYTS